MPEPYEALKPHLHPSPEEYMEHSSKSPGQMGYLRILNGAALPFPVHISLDHRPFAAGVRPFTATGYGCGDPGKRNLRILDGSDPSVLVLEEQVEIPQGGFATVVLADSSRSGIRLFSLADLDCRLMAGVQSCIRAFNGAMEGEALSLAQWNGGILWQQVPFGGASSYCSIPPGPHSFYALSDSSRSPLSSLSLNLQPGYAYTLYLAGNTWTAGGLRILPAIDGR